MNDDPVAISLIQSASRLMVGMAILLAVALVVQMYFHPQHTPDAALTGMLGLVVGAITQNYGAAFSYKFGSTQQSKGKDETIQKQAASLAIATGTGTNGHTVEPKP